jgi:hypothetical protein
MIAQAVPKYDGLKTVIWNVTLWRRVNGSRIFGKRIAFISRFKVR